MNKLLNNLHVEMVANDIEPYGSVRPWRTGIMQRGKKGNKLGFYSIDENEDMYFWTGISRGDEWVKIEASEVME